MSLSGLSGEISSAFPNFGSADFFVLLRRVSYGSAERKTMTTFGNSRMACPKVVIVSSYMIVVCFSLLIASAERITVSLENGKACSKTLRAYPKNK